MVAGSTFGSASSSSSFSLLELHAIRVDAFGKRSIDETIDGSDAWARVSAIVADDVIEESIGIGGFSNLLQSDYASSSEYLKMYQSLRSNNFEIDVTNGDYMFEYVGDNDYKQWDKLFKKIISI
jgi:hypothetical protein